ncbi:MAG: biosynthetic-type acetolactate synthase large subunit [bacterium]|jgi:acetolactate synthase-1/2/3 large subunit
MKMTGAAALVKTLEAHGVDLVFGYPGGAILPLYDALYASKKIRHILTRTEQAAAHAASGYGRVTGKTGVCITTSGPGATNLVTGLATAYMDSVPLVAITGQVLTTLIGKDVFQEVDITGASAPFTKHNYLVKNAADIPRILKEAFYIAGTGRPGPVLIDLPKDIAMNNIEYREPEPVQLRGYNPNYNGHPLQVAKAAAAIASSTQPVIIAGGGINSAGAWSELEQLATKAQIPVVTSLMGLDTFPGNHSLNLGLSGMHGSKIANLAISEADLIIGIGARFGDRLTGKFENFAPQAKLIHIDIDPAEIGKNVSSHISIVGDVKLVLQSLLKQLQPPNTEKWRQKIKLWQKKNKITYDDSNGLLKPQFIMEKISEIAGKDTIFTTEVGQHQMWAAQFLTCKKPRSFLTSGGLGTMGYGLPAAIGAQLGRPEQLVINIAGDGSFQMNMAELATAIEHNLNLKIMLINNNCLGMVRQLQDENCAGRHIGVHFPKNPDFVLLAHAYGIPGLRVTDKEEVLPALQKAMHTPGIYLIDFVVDPGEDVYTPCGKIIKKGDDKV